MTILEQIKKLRERFRTEPFEKLDVPIAECKELLFSPQLTSELEELARLRAGLPKTADGVTLVPEMTVWRPLTNVSATVESVDDSGAIIDMAYESAWKNGRELYSTREAAESALKMEKR